MAVCSTAGFPAQAETLPWLDGVVDDPFGTQKKVADLVAPNLQPDSCVGTPDFSRKLNFSDVVVAVLCNNPDTKGAYLSLSAQGATYATNYAGYLPNATAVIGTSRTHTLGSHSNDIAIERTSAITLSMTLYDFGQREMKLEAAELALLAAGHTYNSTLQGAIAAAMQGYYSLLTAQNALSVSKETERYAKESFDAATLRHEVGQVPLADVLQAKGAYSQQQLGTMQTQNQLDLARSALAQLMGQSADTVIEVQEVDDKAMQQDPFADEIRILMAHAKEQRHDLEAARLGIESSESSLRALKRGNLATVSATADLGGGNPSSINMFRGGKTRSQGAGISVSIPIFTGFANSYNVRAAEKTLEAQKETLRSTELQVEQDVWTSWHNYQTAKQSWQTNQDQLASATELRDVALGRYKEGLGTILDVLNAETQYSSALQSNLQSRYSVFTSRIDLVRSVGALDLDILSKQADDNAAALKEPTAKQDTP